MKNHEAMCSAFVGQVSYMRRWRSHVSFEEAPCCYPVSFNTRLVHERVVRTVGSVERYLRRISVF